MFTRTTHLLTALILAAAAIVQAADAYYDIPVRDLKLVEGKLPKPGDQTNYRHYQWSQSMQPYALIDGQGEAYLTGQGAFRDTWYMQTERNLNIHIRAAEDQEVKGRLVIMNSDRSGMDILRFVVPASDAKPEAKVPFIDAKLAHYDHLVARDIPGGAWFRHQGRVVAAEINRSPAATQQQLCSASQPAGRVDALLRSVHGRPRDQREPATRSHHAAASRQ